MDLGRPIRLVSETSTRHAGGAELHKRSAEASGFDGHAKGRRRLEQTYRSTDPDIEICVSASKGVESSGPDVIEFRCYTGLKHENRAIGLAAATVLDLPVPQAGNKLATEIVNKLHRADDLRLRLRVAQMM